MDSISTLSKSSISQWDTDAVVTWLQEVNFGTFEKVFRDNEIDGSILLKLTESMISRLFPTIKLEVQFLDRLQTLRNQHQTEIKSKKSLHVVPPATTSYETTNGQSSNSSSPKQFNPVQRLSFLESKTSAIPLKALKREPRFFNMQNNPDSNENDAKHTFPHVYKLPNFPETLRLALASQDASAFKLRTYYRNLLISSIYDDLTRTYNLWYPNARQYKTVASALVKAYPFLESSTDGGEGAWIDGIKGKFKRGRRTVTSYVDAAQALGDDDLSENRLASSHKRSRHEFEGDSDDGHFESGEMQITNVRGKDLDQTSETTDELDEDEVTRLRICIRAMQQTLAATNDPDISLILDYFKETFEVRRNFVKTHNTNEILLEYPALRLHSCLLADYHMQTNIPIQTVLIHKIRSISKPIVRLAKETHCAPELLHTYHTILSQRPQLDQIVADTFAILFVASYFGENQYLIISPDKDIQSPWPIIRGDHPARAFFDVKTPLIYNIELDYVQLFHRPLNDFLSALCTLFATYTVFEITYGKLEMTLSFLECLLRDNQHDSVRSPQVLELINELNSMR